MSTKIKQNELANLLLAKKATKTFFEQVSGKLVCSKGVKIETYSSYNYKIPCVNYYVSFDNKYLFGVGNFATEIYPRYRKMRDNWKKYLKECGVKLYPDLALGFVPMLELSNKEKNKKFQYPKENKKPLGVEILTIDENSPDYYLKMSKEFGVNFMLKEGGGMFIGPEGGMMSVLESICRVKKIDCLVDVGAGTGEISAYVLKKSHPKKVVVNELSLKLRIHLKRYLGKMIHSGTDIIFSFGDCNKMKLPNNIDLMSVGVFYGSQPSFFKNNIIKIVKKLGPQGLLLIQSSMPETLFSQHILLGDLDGVKKWPWYSKKFILSNYFSCVESFFIDNQFIILASRSPKLVHSVIDKIDKKFIKYENFSEMEISV